MKRTVHLSLGMCFIMLALVLAALIVAGIGYLLELFIPWPFNGFVSGFESLGWIVMFLGGRKLVMQAIQEQSTMEEKS